MKRLFKQLLIILPMLLVMGVSTPAFAATGCPNSGSSSKSQILGGAGIAGDGDCSGKGVTNIASATVDILSIILGVAAIIMIIIAGFKYITSAGDSGKVSSAKTTLVYALVGVVVAALAQIFVHFAIHTANTALPSQSGDLLTAVTRLNLP